MPLSHPRPPHDLTDLLLEPSLHDVATEALQQISQASALVQICARLARGHARLDALGTCSGIDAREVRLVREILDREADIQHGWVWPR